MSWFKQEKKDILLRPDNVVSYNKETIITNFQTGHGFTKTGTGTQSDDTVDYVRGSQSLKAVTNGAGAAFHSTVTGLTAINMADKTPKVWIKVSDITQVAELWFYMSSANDLSARYVWKIEDDISQLKSNTWCQVTLSFGEATVTGTPNRAAIIALRVWAKDKATSAITVNWGGWSYQSEPSAGICSITFDDGWLSQYSLAYKKMSAYSYKGTCYIIPDYIDTTNYLTSSNLNSLKEAKWDLQAHHQSDLSAMSYEDCNDTLRIVKEKLATKGFITNHFAFPMGRYNENIVMPLVKKYFASARTIAAYAETSPAGDIYKLRIFNVINTTTTAAVATAVTQAINNKEWLILLFHKIEPTTADDETEYLEADFGTVIDNIATQGIAVKTISNVLGV